MPDWFWYLVVFGYGAIVGSFLNVLIYRMPLGLSVSNPPSHCPRCKTKLGFWDNIPLVSFLTLEGRCRYCRVPISWRYFAVELLTASLWVSLFARLSGETGISWVNFVAHALFASVLVAVIFIDLDHFIIPDELNWVGIGLGVARDAACLALAWQAGPWQWKETLPEFTLFGGLPRSIAGAVAYGGLLFLVSFLGYLYYAREEGETLGQTARRFFVYEEEAPEADVVPVPEADAVPAPAAAEEEEEGEPVRLRFSPGFLALVSALLLLPALKGGAVLAFAAPVLAFVVMTRHPGESPSGAFRRFFRADDQQAEGEPFTAEPAEEVGEAEAGEAEETTGEPSPEAALATEADQFAREAETGGHGAMGLGDVKLALAIGALLGPGPAVLSLLFATAAGAITGVTLAAIHGKSLRLAIPFGPFMAFGAIIVMLYGAEIVALYLRLTGLR